MNVQNSQRMTACSETSSLLKLKTFYRFSFYLKCSSTVAPRRSKDLVVLTLPKLRLTGFPHTARFWPLPLTLEKVVGRLL